ncbi:hypothetical protein ACFQYP_21250 [Nonomuraea antimicrobica]
MGGGGRPPLEVPRERWRWHIVLPLAQPPAPGAVERAREAVRPSGAAVDRVRVTSFTEGSAWRCCTRGRSARSTGRWR